MASEALKKSTKHWLLHNQAAQGALCNLAIAPEAAAAKIGLTGTAARLGANAALGAGFQATNAVAQNQPITPGGLALGAGLGAVAPEALGALGRGITGATQTVKEGLVNLAFNRTGKALQKDFSVADNINPATQQPWQQNYAERMLKNFGWYSTANAARKDMQNNIIPNAGKAIGAIADSAVGDRPVQINDLLPSLRKAVKPLTNYLGADDPLVKTLTTTVDPKAIQFGDGSISWRDALALKQAIGNKVLPAGAYTDAKISLANQRLAQANTQLTARLHDAARDTDYDAHTLMYGLGKETLAQLKGKAASFHVNMGERLGIFGSMLAAPLTGGGSLMALAPTLAAERAAQSVPVQLGVAKGLQGLQNRVINPLQQLSKSQQARNLARTALLKSLLSNSPNPSGTGSPQPTR